jgi:hypothetical protein
MEKDKTKIQEEVENNYKFFETQIPQIIDKHCGKYALIRKQAIIDYFDSFSDAIKYAQAVFKDRMYSIQRVEFQTPITLGYQGLMMYS